jgi:hypothetical protein
MAIPAAIPLITGGINLAQGIFGAIGAGKQRRKALAEERRARADMNRLKSIYANLDTSNPYLNMENTMEDLTVNQQQAQFQGEQFRQSQANVLDNLREAAGGSGIASLAQSLAQQGQLNAQRASASIGKQEAINQRLAAQQAGRIQALERKGEVMSRNMRRDQVGTLLGMSQQETAAARQQAAIAQQAKVQAIASGISGATSAVMAGMKYGAFDKQTVDVPVVPPESGVLQGVGPTQGPGLLMESPGFLPQQQAASLPSIGVSSVDYNQNPMTLQGGPQVVPTSTYQPYGGVAPIGGASFDEPTIEELLNTGG